MYLFIMSNKCMIKKNNFLQLLCTNSYSYYFYSQFIGEAASLPARGNK